MNTSVGVAFAAILFGEAIGLTTILAAILIFSGIAIVNSATTRRR